MACLISVYGDSYGFNFPIVLIYLLGGGVTPPHPEIYAPGYTDKAITNVFLVGKTISFAKFSLGHACLHTLIIYHIWL